MGFLQVNKLAAILHNNVLSVMLLLPLSGHAMVTSEELIGQAQQLGLSEQDAWRDLLHMHTGWAGADHSEVADTDFFLADNGISDARAELDATLKYFVKDKSMACRYPARWQWLDQQLGLGERADCAELDAWKQKLAARHITLLFPSMYLQNPASMFGHTFLRLDQADVSPLLSYTLSYAAKPDKQDNVLLYVYKGIFGGYPGVFTVQPYYQTVTDYGDIEHRDIWEYSLDFSAAEIDQLLNHVWELRDKNIDYYFLRENCSYQLLSLLDVARPGMQLTRQHFSIYAIPADTVRSVRDKGLITGSYYRPARASRVTKMYAQLDEPLQSQLDQYLNSSVKAFDLRTNEADHARMLELATEIRQMNNEDASDLLSQRSQLRHESLWQVFMGDDPAGSHFSSRLGIATGDYEHRNYTELSLRPALHDWLDNEAGLIKGASLEVLSLRLRYFSDNAELKLQQLKLFGLQSYTPVQSWYTPISTEFMVGMYRIAGRKVFNAEGGAGLSAEYGVFHGFALATLAAESMEHRVRNEAGYVGAHSGLRTALPHAQFLLDAKWQTSFAGYNETRTIFNAGYQWDISNDYALRLEYVVRRSDDIDETDWQVAFMGYF